MPRGKRGSGPVPPPSEVELITRRWSLGGTILEIHADLPGVAIETVRRVVADLNHQALAWGIGSEDEV